MSDAIRQLERLRSLRARPETAAPIAELIAAKLAEARRTERRLGELTDLWEALVPPEIAARTRLAGLRGGVLRVEVESSSVAYRLDRLLRGGLERELRTRHGGTLVRVRVAVASNV